MCNIWSTVKATASLIGQLVLHTGPEVHPVTSLSLVGVHRLHDPSHSRVCLLVGCLTTQQHASVSQGPICSDNFICCHTKTAVADQTFYLTQSQYTDTGPTSPSTDPIMPGTWQGSHWSHWYDWTLQKSQCKWDSNPGSSGPKADTLTTRPTRRSTQERNERVFSTSYLQRKSLVIKGVLTSHISFAALWRGGLCKTCSTSNLWKQRWYWRHSPGISSRMWPWGN